MLNKVRLIACAFLMMAGTLTGFQTNQRAEAAVPACCDIATTNQANNTIDLYDPAVDDWNSPDALKWSWKPSTALGYSSAEVRLWGGPSEAKRKGSVLVATAGQLATIAAYPSGTRIWAADVGIGSNPHSAELLPNGNLAVAASDGKWIRVYTSSQGPASVSYAQFNLDFAHAAHWDGENELLWVIGYDNVAKQHIMTGLRVGGTDAKPTLTEDTSRRSLLPSPWGHDITPYAGDSNKLWVSTNAAVYLYDIPTKSFTPAPEAANRSFVKSVGNLPSGQIVEARPDNVKTPPGGCTTNGWCTDTVDFYAPDMTRTVSGAAFYKARIWDGQPEERLSVLKGLTAVETFYTGTMPDGGLKLPDYYFVQAASPQDNLILTRFLDPVTGRSYLAVGNPSLTQTQMPVIQFDPERDILQVKEVSPATGEERETSYDSQTGKLAGTLLPGEMKLYALPAGFRYQVPQQLPPEPPAIGPYTNLALHKTVTASSDYGRSGWYARAVTDGQRTSTASSMGWTSYNDIKKNHTEWITVDMGASYKINTLDLYPRADGKNTGLGYPQDFTIQVSEDNVHWSVAASGHQETRPTGRMEYTFPMTSARYVKIEGTQLTGDPFGNYHMQFAEIEVYSRTESHLTLELKPSKLLVGKTGELHVFGWTPDGEIDPLDGAVVSFSSSNPAVAGVDDKGTVTAKAEGEAVLTAEVTKRDGTVDKGEYELVVESLPSPWKADFYGKAYGLINPVEDGFTIRANGLGHGPEEDDLVYLYQDFMTENPVTATSVIDSVYRTAAGQDGSAGIMFRNGSEADASGSFVSLAVNPQGRIVMTARTEAGTVQELKGPYTVFPVELKLVKTGNRFTGFYKKEGAWIPVTGNPGHSGITVNMGKALKAGIAVFSEESELYTAAGVSQIRLESGPGRP